MVEKAKLHKEYSKLIRQGKVSEARKILRKIQGKNSKTSLQSTKKTKKGKLLTK